MKLDDRTKANLDVVLEDACRGLPNGGDHAIRKIIATKLLNAASKGNTTLKGLKAVARQAIAGAATSPKTSANRDDDRAPA